MVSGGLFNVRDTPGAVKEKNSAAPMSTFFCLLGSRYRAVETMALILNVTQTQNQNATGDNQKKPRHTVRRPPPPSRIILSVHTWVRGLT